MTDHHPEADPRGCPRCAHGIGRHLIDCPNAVGAPTDAADELRAAEAVLERIRAIRKAIAAGQVQHGVGWARICRALDEHAAR